MNSVWQIWRAKPPDPKRLHLTHVREEGWIEGPNPDPQRDYKEYIWERYRPRMSPGDIMVAPDGEVWLVELWGFKSLIKPPPPRGPVLSSEELHQIQLAQYGEPDPPRGPHSVTHLHHPDPRAPRPPK